MREAGKLLDNYRLEDTTLYVTLEPCPMCASAMVHARVSRVVFGAWDAKAGGAGSIVNIFTLPELNHRVDVFGACSWKSVARSCRSSFSRAASEMSEKFVRKIRGRESVALRLFGLAFAASLALSVSAQSGAPAVMTREQLQKLLDESGTVMTNLATARTQQLPKDVADKRDKRGQGIQDDLQKNVMSPETEARLKALRESAAKDLAAGDLPGVQVTLVNLRRGLTSEIERYQAIVAYWREIGAPGYRLAVVDEAFLRAHRVEPAYAKELADLRAQIEKQVGAGDFVTAMQTTWPTYENTLRRKAVEESRRIVTSIDSGGFTRVARGEADEALQSCDHDFG